MTGMCRETHLVHEKSEERTKGRKTTSGDGEALFDSRPDSDI